MNTEITIPNTIQEVVASLKNVPQNPLWHPEVDVYSHTAFVWHQLSSSPLLSFVALFHDLGKIDTTVYNDVKKSYTSYGHEFKSLRYVDKFHHILPEDIDLGTVKLLVKYHMTAKYFSEMRVHKQKQLIEELGNSAEDLTTFTLADDARGFWLKTTPEQREEIKAEFQAWVDTL